MQNLVRGESIYMKLIFIKEDAEMRDVPALENQLLATADSAANKAERM